MKEKVKKTLDKERAQYSVGTKATLYHKILPEPWKSPFLSGSRHEDTLSAFYYYLPNEHILEEVYSSQKNGNN